MRKVINHKLYDTETADYLGSTQEFPPRNFRHFEEDLYRTGKGQFFLAGKGGGLSKYRQPTGDGMWCGGSDIFLLSESEAKDWVEQYLSVSDYESIFGSVEEG